MSLKKVGILIKKKSLYPRGLTIRIHTLEKLEDLGVLSQQDMETGKGKVVSVISR
jgi:hypothetical protein